MKYHTLNLTSNILFLFENIYTRYIMFVAWFLKTIEAVPDFEHNLEQWVVANIYTQPTSFRVIL